MGERLSRIDWLLYYAASTGVVLLGVQLGRDLLRPGPAHPGLDEPFLDSLIHWDATYYREIATVGYRYDPQLQSTIHFFPLFPLLGRALSWLTGLPADVSLLLAAHLCFLAALGLLARYTDLRHGPALRGVVLAVVAFVPVGFFFRMAYTESTFLLLCVLELALIQRGASPYVVALVAGAASGVRPVGIALALPLLLYVYRTAPGWTSTIVRTALCIPLSCAGLLGFMAYCHVAFGDGLAFARHRTELWAIGPVPDPLEKWTGLLSLRPLWAIFVPSDDWYWGRHLSGSPNPLFNLYCLNPLYFAASVVLLGVGWRKRWLNGYELLLAAGLLVLPYVLQGLEHRMTGMARYMIVIVPVYFVFAKLTAALPGAVRAGLLGLSSALLAAYAALFAQWYWLV